jgi:tellurite resistance protein
MKTLLVLVLLGAAAAQSARYVDELSPEEKTAVIRHLAKENDALRSENEKLAEKHNQLVRDYNSLLVIAQQASVARTKTAVKPVVVTVPAAPERCTAFTMGENTSIRCY